MKLFAQSVISAAALLMAGGAGPSTARPAALRQLVAARSISQDLASHWAASHPDIMGQSSDGPAITSGKILSNTINAQQIEASPTINFTFKAGPSGFAYAYFMFYDDVGQQSIVLDYNATTELVSGGYTLHTPGSVSPYARPGTYTLAYAGIGDSAGNFTSYTNAQLSSIFSNLTFTVTNNGHPDTSTPQLTSGRIATPTVSLSSSRPLFLADFTVSDTVSGVATIFVELTDPTGAVHTADNAAPFPILRPTNLPVGFALSSYSGATPPPTGTWTISSVLVQDVAGNSLELAGASSIQSLLGADTFQVTQ